MLGAVVGQHEHDRLAGFFRRAGRWIGCALRRLSKIASIGGALRELPEGGFGESVDRTRSLADEHLIGSHQHDIVIALFPHQREDFGR